MTSFKNLIYTAFIISLFFSCENDSDTNFILKGNVKNLKKGVLYLQKDGKSTIINLDSVVVKGEPNFELKANIEEPVLLYLKLQKNDGQEHYIPFFADKGITEINTTLKGFSGTPKIKGSKQQVVLEAYQELMTDFKNKNLDLLKANFEAVKRKDTTTTNSLYKQSERLLRLKYASTINYALNNKNSEVAPYLALYEIPNTSAKYLDSIYNNLTPEIKASLYGKKLGKVLSDFKIAQDSIK